MVVEMQAARRAYELGRMRTALVRAFMGTAIVLAFAVIALGRGAFVWAALPLVALAFVEWRGGALARGGHRGFLAGLVTLALPMSVLRPCCDASVIASGACCTMPSICGVSGIVLGLAVALVWPAEQSRRDHMLAGVGVALGALSIAAMRCGGLFVGEALGLATGLVAGIVASTAARAWMASRTLRSR
jgi:hypothetical protein